MGSAFKRIKNSLVNLVISTSNPQPNGTASAGSSGQVSDAGHIHPMALKTSEVIAWELANVSEVTWAGVAYTDPDAVGANPTATLYPDGTVVGSTDNGTYTKYPDGKVTCHINININWTVSGTALISSIWAMPIVSLITYHNSVIFPSNLQVYYLSEYTGYPTTSAIRILARADTTPTAGLRILNSVSTGRWK